MTNISPSALRIAQSIHNMLLRLRLFIAFLSESRWALFLIFGLYAPLLSPTFGFVDDYCVAGHGSQIRNTILGHGRPLYAIIHGLFDGVATHADFAFMRLLNIGFISGILLVFRSILRRVGADTELASLLAIVFCLLPPVQVFAWWAICTAQLAAMVAILISIRFALEKGGIKWAVFFAAIAMLTYQPACVVYAAVIPLMLYRDGKPGARLLYAAIPYVVAFAIGFVSIKVFSKYSSGDRSIIEFSMISSKLQWYFLTALPKAGSFLFHWPSNIGWMICLPFICAGFYAIFNKSGFIGFIVAFLGVLAASALSLLTKESWASVRSLTPLYCYLAVVSTIGVIHFCNRSGEMAARILKPILFLGIGAFAVFSVSLLTVDIVIPQSAEAAYVSGLLRRGDIDFSRTVYVIPTTWENSVSTESFFDELGVPSSNDWNATRVVEFHARNLGIQLIEVRKVTVEEAKKLPAAQVLDLRRMLSIRLVR